MRDTIISVIFFICALASVLYGFLILSLGSGSRFWLIWEVLGIFFSVLLFMKLHNLYEKIPVIFKIFFFIFLAIGIIIIIVCLFGIGKNFNSRGNKKLDYIIVLGAQVSEDGPRKVLRGRLDTAAEYLKDNPECLCIVSGGQGYNEPASEAEVMKEYLEDKGVSSDRIIVEDKSTNTIENLKFSKKILEEESYDFDSNKLGIVTWNFHMCRAKGIAKKQGLGRVSGISSFTDVIYLPNNIFRECFGLVKDKVFGNM